MAELLEFVFRTLTLVFLKLVLLTSTSWANEKFLDARGNPIPHQIIESSSNDGVPLKLFYFEHPNPNAFMVLEPGLIESAYMLDDLVRAAYASGYSILIGQVRLVGYGKSAKSGAGAQNRLEDVMLQDGPTHLRVAQEIANGLDIHVMGHSMGGMIIMAMLSNPTLVQEFVFPKHEMSRITEVSILASPHNLQTLNPHIKKAASVLIPLFRAYFRNGKGIEFRHHQTIFRALEYLRTHQGKALNIPAKTAERALVILGSALLNGTLIEREWTSTEAVKKLFRYSSAFPIELLLSFGEAAIDGEFRDQEGNPLIIPENFPDEVGYQIIAAEKDTLVSARGKNDLFRRTPGRRKTKVVLKGMNHVDPIMADALSETILPSLLQFHSHPEKVLSERLGKTQEIMPPTTVCQNLLVRASKRIHRIQSRLRQQFPKRNF